MSSPLMLGNDPRIITQNEKSIVLNKDCIVIGQDPTEQGRKIKTEGDLEVWAKKLQDRRVAVLLLNRNATATKPITCKWADVGLAGTCQVRDVYGMKELGTVEASVTNSTPPHACWLLILSPTPAAPAAH